ncbi:unnamed protein product, partial [Aphanomyces euteiches]
WRRKQGRQNDEEDESCEKIGHLSEAKPKVKSRLPKGKQKTKNPPPKSDPKMSSTSEYEEESEREESDYSDEDSDAMHRNRQPPQKQATKDSKSILTQA